MHIYTRTNADVPMEGTHCALAMFHNPRMYVPVYQTLDHGYMHICGMHNYHACGTPYVGMALKKNGGHIKVHKMTHSALD